MALNRKMLSEIAIRNEEAFASLVEKLHERPKQRS